MPVLSSAKLQCMLICLAETRDKTAVKAKAEMRIMAVMVWLLVGDRLA